MAALWRIVGLDPYTHPHIHPHAYDPYFNPFPSGPTGPNGTQGFFRKLSPHEVWTIVYPMMERMFWGQIKQIEDKQQGAKDMLDKMKGISNKILQILDYMVKRHGYSADETALAVQTYICAHSNLCRDVRFRILCNLFALTAIRWRVTNPEPATRRTAANDVPTGVPVAPASRDQATNTPASTGPGTRRGRGNHVIAPAESQDSPSNDGVLPTRQKHSADDLIALHDDLLKKVAEIEQALRKIHQGL